MAIIIFLVLLLIGVPVWQVHLPISVDRASVIADPTVGGGTPIKAWKQNYNTFPSGVTIW